MRKLTVTRAAIPPVHPVDGATAPSARGFPAIYSGRSAVYRWEQYKLFFVVIHSISQPTTNAVDEPGTYAKIPVLLLVSVLVWVAILARFRAGTLIRAFCCLTC